MGKTCHRNLQKRNKEKSLFNQMQRSRVYIYIYIYLTFAMLRHYEKIPILRHSLNALERCSSTSGEQHL